MPWPGGKNGMGVYHRLCAEVPPHDERISPFLGHCGVMQHLRPAAVNVGIDLDETALEHWRGWRWEEQPEARLQLVHGDSLAWLRQRFGLLEWPQPAAAVDRLLSPTEVLQRLYFAPRRGPIVQPSGAVAFGSDARGPQPAAPGSPAAGPRWVPFVFLDPPYPRDTLADRHRYVADLSDEQHEELLTIARSIEALVMIVSYPNRLYETQLRDWRTFTYKTMTRGGPRTEQAWCNYPPPLVLHDHRFIGRDKRQRETIKRRVSSWRKMFRDLPPPIRAAMLEGLIEEEQSLGELQSIFAGVCVQCGTVRPCDVLACCVCRSRSTRPAGAQVFAPATVTEAADTQSIGRSGVRPI